MTDRMPQWINDFVERMGLLWEAEGLPRIAGRIFGFLFIQAEPCSLDDLATSLDVSKASVSTDARRLETLGLIRRIGVPGDRRDYYEIAPDATLRIFDIRLEGFARLSHALDAVLEQPSLPAHVHTRLKHFDDAQRRILNVLQSLRSELHAYTALSSPPATLRP
jgi:DNA-binding transcriptional regulator GbsR (MarR family)